MLVQRIIPAIPPLDAQPPLIDRTVTPLGPEDLAVFHMIGQGTTNSAIRTNAVHGLSLGTWHQRQGQGLVRQCARRARRGTLTAGDARALPHRLVKVEGDMR